MAVWGASTLSKWSISELSPIFHLDTQAVSLSACQKPSEAEKIAH